MAFRPAGEMTDEGASDKRALPDSVTLMLQRAYLLGIVSQERFSDVGISWLRGYRTASRPLGA